MISDSPGKGSSPPSSPRAHLRRAESGVRAGVSPPLPESGGPTQRPRAGRGPASAAPPLSVTAPPPRPGHSELGCRGAPDLPEGSGEQVSPRKLGNSLPPPQPPSKTTFLKSERRRKTVQNSKPREAGAGAALTTRPPRSSGPTWGPPDGGCSRPAPGSSPPGAPEPKVPSPPETCRRAAPRGVSTRRPRAPPLHTRPRRRRAAAAGYLQQAAGTPPWPPGGAWPRVTPRGRAPRPRPLPRSAPPLGRCAPRGGAGRGRLTGTCAREPAPLAPPSPPLRAVSLRRSLPRGRRRAWRGQEGDEKLSEV